MDMKALNLQKRTFALIENGSWAPQAAKLMRAHLEDMKDMTILDNEMSVNSSLKEGDEDLMDSIAESIIESMNK
jgi:flavorubredoxin